MILLMSYLEWFLLIPSVIAVLKALHLEKMILTEEECRGVGEDGKVWNEELALAVALKPPDVMQNTLNVLNEYNNGEQWYSIATESIKGLPCLPTHTHCGLRN